MIITIPFPPSTNSLWRAVKGRNIKSKAYREWEREAGYEILVQTRGLDARIFGPVNVTIKLRKPDKRRRDVDNHIKAPLDLIVAHGLIDDDRNVQSVLAYWHSEAEGCEIEVRRA